jgi:hypothetical protein
MQSGLPETAADVMCACFHRGKEMNERDAAVSVDALGLD